ncbi:hypothetical protein GPECTOR_48g442 [Gonium pectorale]|uniref:WSC domain-containing protein n=1 Tax=Gonium pectorale TaxID=33097 RepID=A0A150G9I5_GONPE|nr:hypothetical protein GPECTOR_48g442 [Gonium pectorale]|eukprot:KXZ46010.1 hypothetical protein GPECTOR_48g442 [Gonium pectorale]
MRKAPKTRVTQDFCAAGACGPASCSNVAASWTCGPCPNYTFTTTTTVLGVKGPTCLGYDAGYYLGCFAASTGGSSALPVQLAKEGATPRLCAALARAAAAELGCFADVTTSVSDAGRLLPRRISPDGLLPAACSARAASAKLAVYGMQSGGQCFGGTDFKRAFSLGPSTKCRAACTADPLQICGGRSANSVFLTGGVEDGPPNLALQRPAYASSTVRPSVPQKAVDGRTYYSKINGLPYIFHSNDTGSTLSGPWLSVDLGAPAMISRIVIWNRCDCCAERLQKAELRIGNVSITTAPADTAQIAENPIAWKQTVSLGLCASEVVTFSTPEVGRWVTLQNKNLDRLSYLHITELQVFGYYPGSYSSYQGWVAPSWPIPTQASTAASTIVTVATSTTSTPSTSTPTVTSSAPSKPSTTAFTTAAISTPAPFKASTTTIAVATVAASNPPKPSTTAFTTAAIATPAPFKASTTTIAVVATVATFNPPKPSTTATITVPTVASPTPCKPSTAVIAVPTVTSSAPKPRITSCTSATCAASTSSKPAFTAFTVSAVATSAPTKPCITSFAIATVASSTPAFATATSAPSKPSTVACTTAAVATVTPITPSKPPTSTFTTATVAITTATYCSRRGCVTVTVTAAAAVAHPSFADSDLSTSSVITRRGCVTVTITAAAAVAHPSFADADLSTSSVHHQVSV